MMHSRPPAWLLALSLGGLVAASSGCTRPAVAPVSDGASAAEPAPPSAGDADKGPADDKKDADAPAFHFPDDAGGALLAKVLPPAEVKGPLDEPNSGPPRPSPAGLVAPPSPPLPPAAPPAPPAPGERAHQAPAPRLVIDETRGPARGDPQPPAPRSFSVGDRTRLPSVDVNQPPPLPVLAEQPTPDRASLDDPTVDASTEAALAATMPKRTNPAPYVRITTPDPFDNHRPLSLPLPAEDDRPRTGTVHPPKP